MARVTAVITAFNRASTVGAAVNSVLAQTFGDLELVVVDDGSTDGTAEVLRAYGDRITVITQANRGRAEARNAGVRVATGDYIGFLDSDDLWLPDRIERQVPVLDAQPGVGLVHGHVEVIDLAGEPLVAETKRMREIFERAHRRAPSYARYALGSRCLTSTILVRREAFDRVGLYDPAIAVEDVELYLRLALAYGIVFLGGAPLARYRVHPGQTDGDEMLQGHADTALKHLAVVATRRDIPQRRLARRNLLIALGLARYRQLDAAGTRQALLRAVASDPAALAVPHVARALLLSLLPTGARRAVRP